MTTPAAAEAYRMKHEAEMAHKGYAVYNPNNLPFEELPVIYGFNNGRGWSNHFIAQLLAEDGHGLGSHVCSSESYMRHDLGILEGTRSDRHEDFRKHYPKGYRMEFIPSDALDSHSGFNTACEKAKILIAEDAAKEGDTDEN